MTQRSTRTTIVVVLPVTRTLLSTTLPGMEITELSLVDKVLLGITATFLGLSVAASHAQLVLAIYCASIGKVHPVDLGLSIFMPVLMWAGFILCTWAKESNTSKINIRKFWRQAPNHAPWLKSMPTQVFTLLAITTICFTVGHIENCWHVATVHFSPIVIPPEARDLNKVFHFNVRSLADTLLNVAGAACIPNLALLLTHDRLYLPRCVKRWTLELSKTDCEYKQLELLDIITTSNLYMKKFEDADESSTLMLNIGAAIHQRNHTIS